MAVRYTKVSFPKIEEKLFKVLNSEFSNIYVSSEYVEQQGDESIRIHLSSSGDILTTNMFQRREYVVEVFIITRKKIQLIELSMCETDAIDLCPF